MRKTLETRPCALVSSVLAQFDEKLYGEWEKFSIEWAERMICMAERSDLSPSAREMWWEIADHACRKAQPEPNCYSRLPGWFGPRVRLVLGHNHFQRYQPAWVDHSGLVDIDINGERVRCFVSEPYPWGTEEEMRASPIWKEMQHIGQTFGSQMSLELDGPCEPFTWRHKGVVIDDKLREKSWLLAKHLFARMPKAVSYSDLAEPV